MKYSYNNENLFYPTILWRKNCLIATVKLKMNTVEENHI